MIQSGVIVKRRNIVLVIVALLVNANVCAQVMGVVEPIANVGVKAGVGVQQLSSTTVKAGSYAMLGAYVHKNIERFGIRLELQGSFTKFTTKLPASTFALSAPGLDTVSKGEFHGVYVHIPLLIEYAVSKNLSAFAGPQFNYLAMLNDINGVYTGIYGEGKLLKPTDFAFVGGIELLVAKDVYFGVRIIQGLTDINNSTFYLKPDKWALTGMQLSVSYKIM